MFDDDVYYRFVQNKEGLLRLILIQLMAWQEKEPKVK